MTLAALLQEKSILVTAGSGGTGKTSIAAAMAVAAAVKAQRRVLVMTIDPARRLASALGLPEVGNDPVRVATESGELFAAMLDTKQSWDDLVNQYAPDAATKARITENPLYRSITERFVQSHDYIAMERLWAVHNSGKYDLIIIDTPPSSHASDFLDAPERMADFFDSRLLKFLVAPSRSSFVSITSRPFLQIADKLLGKRFLADISEFFSALESMRPGFIERAEQVQALLREQNTAFVVVTTLEPAPRKEARGFMDQLQRRNLALGGVVFNRVLPDSLLDADVVASAAVLRGGDVVSNFAEVAKVDVRIAEQVLNEVAENFDRFRRLAEHEKAQRQSMINATDVDGISTTVPWFEDDLHSMEGVTRLASVIWG